MAAERPTSASNSEINPQKIAEDLKSLQQVIARNPMLMMLATARIGYDNEIFRTDTNDYAHFLKGDMSLEVFLENVEYGRIEKEKREKILPVLLRQNSLRLFKMTPNQLADEYTARDKGGLEREVPIVARHTFSVRFTQDKFLSFAALTNIPGVYYSLVVERRDEGSGTAEEKLYIFENDSWLVDPIRGPL